MNIRQHKLAHMKYVVVAVGLVLAAIAPVFTAKTVHAFPSGQQIQTRAIRISTSVPSASASYLVTFKPGSNHTATGIVLDFCDSASTPIIGDSTCTLPTTFSVGTPTVNTAPAIGGFTDLGGTWTPTSANSGRTLKMTSSGVALSTANTYAFVITTITNPSATGTFYARFISYTGSTAGGTEYALYAPGTEGSTSATDYGGFALSTANTISITAKVQETLTFCVSGADLSTSGLNTDCTGATAPTIVLGHGTPAVLTPAQVDHTSVFTQTSTNAANGVNVRMRNLNTCANVGLSSNGGTTCNIPGQQNTAASGITAGTASFGLYVANSNFNATGSGTVTPDGNYHDGAHTNIGTGDLFYGMDDTGGSGVGSTYGDTIATSTGPLSLVNNELVFAATASNTTAAGIYTANMILMCTGSF